MQHCSGTNADSDATWQSSQTNATVRTRRRIAVISGQSNGNGGFEQTGVRCAAMRKPWILAGMAILMGACVDSKSPLAPTAIAGPTPPLTAPPLPTGVPGVLAVALPLDQADAANTVFGIRPFGYHGVEHAADGHTGWDIEYRIGGIVRAAAPGRIENVIENSQVPGRFAVQVEHVVGTHHYRTTYTNLAGVNSGIVVDENVITGQPIGTAGTVTDFRTDPPRGPVSYAMTHFQLDDFEYYNAMNSPNAVSPEPFLTASATSLFNTLWPAAAFPEEVVEPYATSARVLTFPASRRWTRAGGDGPAGIRFTRRTATTTAIEYELLTESGTVVEAGTVSLIASARPFPFIDLVSPTAGHIGIYEIVSNEMRMSLTTPGSQRPLNLSGASIYRTAP